MGEGPAHGFWAILWDADFRYIVKIIWIDRFPLLWYCINHWSELNTELSFTVFISTSSLPGDSNGSLLKKSSHFPSSTMRENVPLYQNSNRENGETTNKPLERSNKGNIQIHPMFFIRFIRHPAYSSLFIIP